MSDESPTFRDLYEQSERVNEKLDKQDSRLRRVEVAVVALAVASASPVFGGPSPRDVVAVLLGYV